MKTSLSSSDMIKQEVSQHEDRSRSSMARVTKDTASFRVDRWNFVNMFVFFCEFVFCMKHEKKKLCNRIYLKRGILSFFRAILHMWHVIVRLNFVP